MSHHRWNIDEDGDDLLICKEDHEKGEKCNYVRYVKASERDSLREDISKAKEALREVVPSLAAAISLLDRSPKTAAPSNRMFDVMLKNYKKSLSVGRAAFAELFN